MNSVIRALENASSRHYWASRSHGSVEVDVIATKCSCGLMSNMGLMCRHIMRYVLSVDHLTEQQLATKCIEWAHDRWTQINQQSLINASTEQENQADDSEDAITGLGTPNYSSLQKLISSL